jgi:hypothetical protein
LALTPPNDQALLREVDDAVRADLMMSTWTRFGRWIVLAVVAALALFGGWLWWSNHRTQTSGLVAERMAKVIDIAQAGKPDAGEIDALAKASQPGYRANALLLKAGAAAKAGKRPEAIALYKQMAADTGLSQAYRDLATIKQTVLEFDTMTPDAVIARLKPLAVQDSPWFGSAGEMTGIAYMKKGDFRHAGPIFAALANDAKVPASIHSRAVQMAGLLGVDAVKPAGPVAPPVQ